MHGKSVNRRRRDVACGVVWTSGSGAAASARHRAAAYGGSPGISAISSTSSIDDTRWIFRSPRTFSGMSSLTAFSLRFGGSLLDAERCAARTFSLMPPTGSTRPESVISPVIATRGRTGRPVSSETSAVASVTPAEGPSFGMAPSGTCRCRSTRSKNDSSIPSCRAWARTQREGGLGALLHHVAELAGERQALLAAHLRGLDVEHLAAGRGPGEAGRDARDQGALVHLLLAHEVGRAQELLDLLGRDARPSRSTPSALLAGDLADDARDLALEVPQAGLARVLADQLHERVVAEGHLLGRRARGSRAGAG